jgi:hypothetical protein
MRFPLKTWHLETLVVAMILVVTNLLTRRGGFEWVGSLAVLLSFGHASIGDRLAERQLLMERPDVECYSKLIWYFVGKELCWIAYFLHTRSYPALVGCGVFLLHPPWRRWYRKRFPVGRHLEP